MGAKPRITADTITDEQIRELRRTSGDPRVIDTCDEALWDEHIVSVEITRARARCAEILNARAAGRDT